MAFDYGSIDLGLKNPFKLEGKTIVIRGCIEALVGIVLLVIASSLVKEDTGTGWILMIFGMLTLGLGIKTAGAGVFSIMRFFVGRNHPTSLAHNFSQSERSTAEDEAKDVAYQAKEIEEMLMGRKNITFKEPIGFLSRLLHSIFPKLLFLPYPIRNLAQRLFGASISTIVALVAYGLVAFVTLAGFAGQGGQLTFPIYSMILMIYVLFCWKKAGRNIARDAEHTIESLGAGALAKIISLSFLLPVAIGLSTSWFIKNGQQNLASIDTLLMLIPDIHSGLYLIGILIFALFATTLIFIMLKARVNHANPVTEVSELRENWQESIHPNEIFINLDNLVMANRRYKEVPNRIYCELDPKLNEQIEGKGDFSGELIQEIQPKFKPLVLGNSFIKSRLLALLLGNITYLIALLVTVLFAYSITDIYQFLMINSVKSVEQAFNTAHLDEFSSLLMTSVHLLLIGVVLRAFARLLTTSAHLFFAEMQFESMLVYFKCEGTFTESKISTGKGINDSTQSENVLVRSSITPWVIVTRVISTTFAATGIKNLEHPRYIMELHKDDDQLSAIKSDVISFLKDRESIATITSERDLGNASQLYQLNEQTRAKIEVDTSTLITHQDDAAGYIQQQD